MQKSLQNKITTYTSLALGLLPCLALADYTPFQIRDQNPFNLVHGQPLPVNAEITLKNQWTLNTSLAITNTPNMQQTNNESIFLDYESYYLNTGFQYGLDDNWALKIDLPVIYRGAGFLDSSINDWHNFFHLPQGNRPGIPDNQYQINRTENTRVLTNLEASSTGIGDLQLSLGHQISSSEQSCLSVWTSLKLPTGDADKLNGNDAIDLSAWIALNKKPGENWRLNTNAGLVLPAIVVTGDETATNTDISSYVLFGYMMLAWQPLDILSLKVQLEAHSSYYKNSALRILGSTYLATFGGTVHINQCNSINLAFSEDIKVDASPDISFLLGWQYRNGC